MKSLLSALAALALATGCATAQPQAAAPVQYAVVKPDASIPFASTIRGFRVGRDAEKSLLIEGSGGKWYRATLRDYCRRLLPWENAIALVHTPADSFDRFSEVIVDGQRCQVVAVDEIADPDARPAATPAPRPAT